MLSVGNNNKNLLKGSHQEQIAIIGLGYVGLPLAMLFADKYSVVGYDIDYDRINELKNGFDRTGEVDAYALNDQRKLKITSDSTFLFNCNYFIITVPTPLKESKIPDLGPLLSATQLVGRHLKKGDTVIFESTVYPGCTEEECVPLLEKLSGLSYNVDFFCGYSPERINPGDKVNTLKKIKKVTSGSTPESAARIDALYSSVIEAGTYLAPSIKVAEAAKSIENAQRDINISFVNELALIFDKMNLDTHDVLAAAGTKWNFLPFVPGLVGGHCIGVDPYYLMHKAKKLDYEPHVILSGRKVNDMMPSFVAEKLIRLLMKKGNSVKGAEVLLMGITFKENCPDVRNSKAIDIASYLSQSDISVDIYDPVAVGAEKLAGKAFRMVQYPTKKYDGILIVVPHSSFLAMDICSLKKSSCSVVFDLKGAFDRQIVDARL